MAGKNPKDSKLPSLKTRKKNFERLKQVIERSKFIGGMDCTSLIEKSKHLKDKALKQSAHDPDLLAAKEAVSEDDIFSLSCLAIFKAKWTTLQSSGVILAGFGALQYFPQLLHYTCYGVILDTVIIEEGDPAVVTIDRQNISEVVPMAISDMVKTFMYGSSWSVLGEIEKVYENCMSRFCEELNTLGHLDGGIDCTQIQEKLKEEFLKNIADYLSTNHMEPLRRVVGMLSLPELANLAETLISIESLKERVTAASEYVSGPIDVAVISKSDGFIWLKRKHYFEKDLNPRYFARKGLS